jgi:hypothetical protein
MYGMVSNSELNLSDIEGFFPWEFETYYGLIIDEMKREADKINKS